MCHTHQVTDGQSWNDWRLPHSHQGRRKGTIDGSRGKVGIPTRIASRASWGSKYRLGENHICLNVDLVKFMEKEHLHLFSQVSIYFTSQYFRIYLSQCFARLPGAHEIYHRLWKAKFPFFHAVISHSRSLLLHITLCSSTFHVALQPSMFHQDIHIYIYEYSINKMHDALRSCHANSPTR